MQSSKTFCRLLDNGLVYNNDTTHFTVSPCCYFSKSYRIQHEHDLTAQLAEHKKTWLAEDRTQTCRQCLDVEQAGGHSYRQASFEITPGMSDNIENLTVAVTKKCNLACASCGPESSSFWYQENQRNHVDQPLAIHNLHAEDRQGHITQRFVSLLDNQDLSNLTYVKFGGGEPLMNDTHTSVLERIPCPDQVTLQYTSNFSIMPSARTLELWSKFRLVKWVASLDGINNQFELLRWPYKWPALEHFVDRALHGVPGNVMFGVEHTINPLNVFYFDQFQAWFDQTFSKNLSGDATDLNIHVCYGKLDLSNTPPAVRDMVQNKLGRNHTINILLEQNPWSGSSKSMVAYLDQLDSQRRTVWRETFSEIQAFYV